VGAVETVVLIIWLQAGRGNVRVSITLDFLLTGLQDLRVAVRHSVLAFKHSLSPG
jgi:hypothetical protein